MEHADGDDRTSGLFSRQATDNAEVVPPSAPRTHDELWSTETGEPDVERPSTRPEPNYGSDVFSAEPVERDGDVLDEAVDEAVDEPPPPLHFGLGGDGPDPSLWRDLPPPDPTRRSAPDWSVLRDEPADEPRDESRDEPRDEPAGSPGSTGGDDPAPGADRMPAEDPNGFEAAVRRIDPAARQRATVALVVAGALLLPGELVEEVVTGSMLGSSAVLVVTGDRVLVVNDRRWQPVVDVYRLDHGLTVRGRSDRGVAAISVTDEDHLSMVDGITDVEAAMAVADRIRAALGAF